MFSKIKDYIWRNPQEKDNQSKTETPDEFDLHGANRWDHVDFDDIDQVGAELHKFTIAQTTQFVGGLAAGVYFTATNQPLANPPADNVYQQGNRQEFADKLAAAAADPRVQASEHAMDAVRVMQGQNYAQEAQQEPMPKNTLSIFVDEQVYGHVELDEKARAEGKPCASVNAHKNWDIKCHQKHQEAFWNAGYISGNRLHRIAEIKESWSKEGEFEFPPTCSNDDPLIFHAYTEEDYDRMYLSESRNSSDSDIERNSVDEVIEEVIKISVEETISNDSGSVITEETLSVSGCSATFFAQSSNEAQKEKNEKSNEESGENYWGLEEEFKIGGNFV
ncbi:Uncharacterised protein [Legionella steigerwaltii]|uniref:Uncharacterized protein n=1 Tax=Legionella steigerwaltii TaxID=460 RepID=A0A378LC19_9GAMM|nr:hypothetical protein [Legionella steigerwaltii]KTD80870.1 hypothetical protein Lstg_0097 [Legionella steigerwaltii]STY23442.1 Uncharacterised protein [Legionella steigerwaltii]